jgi:hypothetical protein
VKRLVIDGKTGKTAIMNNRSRQAFENPAGYLKNIHFHSDLAYFSVRERVRVPIISLEGHANTIFMYYKKGGNSSDGKKRVYVASPYVLSGSILLGTFQSSADPTLIFLTYNGVRYSDEWAYRSAIKSASGRDVHIAWSGNSLYLHHYIYSSGWYEVAPLSITDIDVIRMPLNTAPDPVYGGKTIHITPGIFIASGGKLDSRSRYIRKSSVDTGLSLAQPVDAPSTWIAV